MRGVFAATPAANSAALPEPLGSIIMGPGTCLRARIQTAAWSKDVKKSKADTNWMYVALK